MLSQPLTLSLPENDKEKAGPWVFDQNKLANMLAIERVQTTDGARYQVMLESAQLRAFLTQLSPSLKRTPANARFIFNDTSKQLEVLQHSQTGRSLDVEASLRAIQEKLVRGEHNVTLAIQYSQPAVPDTATGERLGIRELVRAETSYYYGSNSARVQNIKAAASRFHGLMVAPGETFSMAAALGDISLDNGYAEALIILGNQTIKGVGGGVCQVSTTLFRTAFFAGFPIVERHAHAYRVYYYEKVAGNKINARLAGLDATVFVPLVDLKFKNDTPNWLLMETYVTPASSSITWKFYSTSDGRKVEWDTTGPTNIVAPPEPIYRENSDLKSGEIKQVDWAAEGADVTVTRTVTRGGSVIIKDRIVTHYAAWADAYEYGPGTEIP
jgi:vancomycin resistance protein YoaR